MTDWKVLHKRLQESWDRVAAAFRASSLHSNSFDLFGMFTDAGQPDVGITYCHGRADVAVSVCEIEKLSDEDVDKLMQTRWRSALTQLYNYIGEELDRMEKQ